MMIPEFIVNRILLSTLMLDKGIAHGSFKARFNALPGLIADYLNSIDSGFVSDNSQEFKDYLEEQVGEISFAKPFAVRIRPDSVRLFVNGKEVFK